MKKRLALSLNQDQSKNLEKVKTMALITGFYEAKSVNEELNIVLKKDNCIIVGNECNQFAAKIGFAGKVIHLDNPLSSGLMKSALHYLKIKKFQSPDPLYLRTANVSEPIHWKKTPVIE